MREYQPVTVPCPSPQVDAHLTLEESQCSRLVTLSSPRVDGGDGEIMSNLRLLHNENYSPLPIRRESDTELEETLRSTSETGNGLPYRDNDEDGETESDSRRSEMTLQNGVPHAHFPVPQFLLAEKLRETNFLIGEKESLVSTHELVRSLGSSKKLDVYLCTWNMSSNKPSGHLSMSDLLLPSELGRVPHVYVIAVQEAPFTGGVIASNEASALNAQQQKDMADLRRRWEVNLQVPLCPSHVLLHSATLGCLHIVMFVRRDLTWHCTIPRVDTYNSRPVAANRIKTKGALAMSVTFFGTSFLFINCHLPAHEDKLKRRIEEYEKICSYISLTPEGTSSYEGDGSDGVRRKGGSIIKRDVTTKFDIVFWLGDLNFRVERPTGDVLRLINDTRRVSVISHLEMTADRPARYESLLKHDQLHRLINAGTAFNGFQEAPISFAPTYKFLIGDPSNQYDVSMDRSPSYTDRILFRIRKLRSGFSQSDLIRPLYYGMYDSAISSDHKPVYGIFSVTLRSGRHHDLQSWNSLNMGQFDRSIFQEALRRRLVAAELGQLSETTYAIGRFMGKLNQSDSQVCVIS